MDKEMLDRLIAIQMKHNPQTRVGAAIVVTELLQAMREPTDGMIDAADTGEFDPALAWRLMIDAITGDK